MAVEQMLGIIIEGMDSYTLMCSPTDDLALAAGFVLTEGIISAPEGIEDIRRCDDDPSLIRIRLRDPIRRGEGRGSKRIVTASCGLCGEGRSMAELLAEVHPVADSLRISESQMQAAVAELCSRQDLFRKTGGTHAAGIFDASASLVAMGEDIGRHNALDKAIGRRLLENLDCAGCGVVLSSRVSFELVAKCARAGIELMAAVSAPSSLALEVAEYCHITVCGFVRGDRATVYTHPFRIRKLAREAR